MEICVDLWTMENVAIHLRQGYGGQDVKMLPISNVAVTAPCGGSRPLGQRTRRAKRVPSFQFSMPMKHGEELWVGVGNSEPETSNPEPETKISILQDSKSRL